MRKKNYPKLIKKAADYSNRDGKLIRNNLYFYDHLDWEIVKDRGVWTDVFLKIGRDSVFAFTISSSFAGQGFIQGTVPESYRSPDGTWDLYVHSKYISQRDVGLACMKWVQLQGRLPGICLGCNVHFNEQFYGHAFQVDSYPPERLNCKEGYLEDLKEIETYIGPLRNLKGGVCG